MPFSQFSKIKRKNSANDSLAADDLNGSLLNDCIDADSNDSLSRCHDGGSSSLTSNDLNERRLRQRQANYNNSIKSNESNSRLQQCLDYIHRLLSRKDKEDFFQYPVTDLIAPGYSSIIKKPMDFSTMKKKIDNFIYNNILEYRDDFVLMCENAMTYNKSDTIYYYAAKKLLESGLKVLNKDRLLSLRRTLGIMKNLTPMELGFVPEGEEFHEQTHIFHQPPRKKPAPKTTSYVSHSTLVARSSILQKLEALNAESRETPEEILSQSQSAAKSAAEKLANKHPHSKMGFLRRNSNGTTSLNFLNQKEATVGKELTVGNLSEAFEPNSYSMNSYIEDKKEKATPVHYLEYGPFSSHAPTYDSSFSNISKEESDLLMATYGDETAYQYALSLMDFAKGTGPLFNNYVDHVLNSLTNNNHEKYLQNKKSTKTDENNSKTSEQTPPTNASKTSSNDEMTKIDVSLTNQSKSETSINTQN